jgi:hypothetical protein
VRRLDGPPTIQPALLVTLPSRSASPDAPGPLPANYVAPANLRALLSRATCAGAAGRRSEDGRPNRLTSPTGQDESASAAHGIERRALAEQTATMTDLFQSLPMAALTQSQTLAELGLVLVLPHRPAGRIDADGCTSLRGEDCRAYPVTLRGRPNAQSRRLPAPLRRGRRCIAGRARGAWDRRPPTSRSMCVSRSARHAATPATAVSVAPTAADLTAVADQLETCPRGRRAAERKSAPPAPDPGATRRRTSGDSTTYRLVTPAVCATSEKVERTGIEPVTSGLQSRRSPS